MTIQKKNLIQTDRNRVLRRIVRMVMGMAFMTITSTISSKGTINMDYQLTLGVTKMRRKCGNDWLWSPAPV